MIVDFHTHIFPEKIAVKTIQKLEAQAGVKAYADGREDCLVASMKKAGVDVSIILPVVTAAEQFDTVNHFAAALNEKYKGKDVRLLSFGGIHPDSPDYKKQLMHIKSLGLQGIKLHPDYQNTYFDDIRYMRILDYASQLDLTTVVHAGIDIGYPDHVRCTIDSICKVLDEVRPKKLVLAHYGGFRLWDDVERRIAGRDVYLDMANISGVIEDEIFLKILNKHGADKILFATDSPWSGQAESLAHVRKLVKDRAQLQKILGQNAQKLVSFGPQEKAEQSA
ncbi:hypothetical protein C823_002639 [Eubacterium plexicaudatum ASF492]|uniref:Amidohydrolase-related domain-containing protein n=1 Tax=Eubacterium plexicaudatum ASF492 TaxID=1235802 RepID=N2A9M4_9FIRM|nr:hypothetical protein C823_002639 [Eubacterium plexicaudatum ASF492]